MPPGPRRGCGGGGGAGRGPARVARRGTGERVMSRARDEGVQRIETLRLRSGLRPASDMRDLCALRAWLPGADVVHVHRGKEHWLPAIANRPSPPRRAPPPPPPTPPPPPP